MFFETEAGPAVAQSAGLATETVTALLREVSETTGVTDGDSGERAVLQAGPDEPGPTEQTVLVSWTREEGEQTGPADSVIHRWKTDQYRVLLVVLGIGAILTAAVGVVVLEVGQILATRQAQGEELAVAVSLNQFILLVGFVPVALFAPGMAMAVWVGRDAATRRMNAVGPVVWTVLVGPLGAAIHCARRKLLPGEVREGGVGWNICRWFAVNWIACLAFWFVVLVLLGLWSFVRGYPVVALLMGGGAIMMLWTLTSLVVVPLFALACLGYLLKLEHIVERGE